MNFYRLIKSLDELVYEVLSWLLFYPLTLWRVLTRPVEMMRKVEAELAEDDEHSFDEILAPPLFLAITLGLIHLVELYYDPVQAQAAASGRFADFLADDKNLLAFRIILFGSLPLVAAVRQARLQGQALEKRLLRSSVYAQCYVAALFSILINVGVFAGHLSPVPYQGWAVLIAIPLAVAWLGWVEARWLHRVVGLSRQRALAHSALILGQWFLIAMAATLAMG